MFDIQMHRDTEFSSNFPLSTSWTGCWFQAVGQFGSSLKVWKQKTKTTECSKFSILNLKEHILLLTDFQWMHLFAKNPWEEGEGYGIGIARGGHMAMGNL